MSIRLSSLSGCCKANRRATRPAHAVSHEVNPVESPEVQETQQIIGEGLNLIRALLFTRPTVAAMIECEGLKTPGKGIHHRLPRVYGVGESVHRDEGRSPAFHDVREVHSIHRRNGHRPLLQVREIRHSPLPNR